MDKSVKVDDRKQEFLLTALELFNEKGYEKTTIQDIIDRMGVSKGAFYHYFQSKEDILTNIAKEYVQRGITLMKKVADQPDLTALEKINNIIEVVNQYKANSEEKRSKVKGAFRKDFKKEENLKLESKIIKSIKQETSVLWQQIIDQGIEEGLFKTNSSKELAEFTLDTINNLDTSIDELLVELSDGEREFDSQEFLQRLDEKLQFYEEALAKVFTLAKGKINLREPYLIRFTMGIQ